MFLVYHPTTLKTQWNNNKSVTTESERVESFDLHAIQRTTQVQIGNAGSKRMFHFPQILRGRVELLSCRIHQSLEVCSFSIQLDHVSSKARRDKKNNRLKKKRERKEESGIAVYKNLVGILLHFLLEGYFSRRVLFTYQTARRRSL